MSDMRLVVAGAAGRMGRVLIEIIRQTPGAHLAAAIEQPGSIAIGQDAGLLAGCGQMGVGITGDALGGITRHPFADGARTDACGSCGGLRRLAARDLHDDPLSTNRRQSGIVMDVHPVLLWNAQALQPQLPRSGPDGQPMESSQLEQAAKKVDFAGRFPPPKEQIGAGCPGMAFLGAEI